MELGLHIADFTWNGGAAALGPHLARHAKNAEDASRTQPIELRGCLRARIEPVTRHANPSANEVAEPPS